MKQMLNTLYVTTQGSYLHKEGEAIVIEVERVVKAKLPIHNIGSIVCFGNVLISPFLLGHCGANAVSISFLSAYGRFLAQVNGPQSGNVFLRREQYRRADDQKISSDIARMFIFGKVNNCRTVLQRHLRDHPETEGNNIITSFLPQLASYLHTLLSPLPMDQVRGVEGIVAQNYFSFWNVLLSQKSGFRFQGRSRRPPMDPINALLSFIYTLLAHDCRSACEAVGLDSQAGFLHRDRPGRPSLALDLMEELRPVLGDRLVLSLVNRLQVKQSDFLSEATGAVIMKDKVKKLVLNAWQERKKDEITHPFLQEKIQVGLLPLIQARILSRYLRDDLEASTIPLEVRLSFYDGSC